MRSLVASIVLIGLASPSAGAARDLGTSVGIDAQAVGARVRTGTQLIGRDGRPLAALRFGSGTGYTVRLASGGDVAEYRDLRFETAATTATGLTIDYTPAGFANRNGRRVYTNNLTFAGDAGAHGWSTAMHLVNINGSQHDNLWIVGINDGTDHGAQATNTISPIGVLLDGTHYGTDHQFTGLHAYSVDTVLKIAGATEGVVVDKAVLVNVGMGISWTPDTGYGGRPGFYVLNSHINSYRGAVYSSAVQQTVINGGEFYHNPGSGSNWVGVELNNAEDASVINTGFYRYLDPANPATSIGISIKGAATKNVMICGDDFGGKYTRLDSAIVIAADVPDGAVTLCDANVFGAFRGPPIIAARAAQITHGRLHAIIQESGARSSPP